MAELEIFHIQGYTFRWAEWGPWSGCSGPCNDGGPNMPYNRTRQRLCNSRENAAIVNGTLCEAAYSNDTELMKEVETCGQGPCEEGKFPS